MQPTRKIANAARYAALLLALVVPACGGSGNGGVGGTADTTPPIVSFTNPANGAASVPINQKITATFSKAMDASTISSSTFSVQTSLGALVAGTISYDAANHIAVFVRAGSFAASTSFIATITTGARDLSGNPLALNKVWTFTTSAAADITAPTVVSTNPLNAAATVPINRNVNATFSEAMDSSTFTSATFTLAAGATPVSGIVTYAGMTATFTPAGNLAPNTLHTATITTGVKDLAANSLAANFTWTFTTSAIAAVGPAPVVLGTAGNYVILAKTGIDTVPASVVTGDLGASPIAATGITGFTLVLDASGQFSTSSQVTGKIYAADYAAPTPSNLTTAVGDMLTAFADAAGRAPDVTALGAGNIGGLTIYPGVFQWSTDVTVPTDVTLSGGPNDVWIFQIAGNLSVAGAKNVILSGGAQAKNVFWQVAGGSGLTLGAGAHFEGIVLAQTAVNTLTAASVNGRLLAQTAVNIQSSTVTQPAP
jgi:hypothetical protein